MNYTFRIRFNRAPSNTIQTNETQIELPTPEPGVSLSLRASSPGKSLKDAERWALIGEGYKTEAEASDAGIRIQVALMLALARLRLGADFGYRTPRGAITKYGLEHFERQLGARVLNDVHGLSVYRSDPKPRFMEFKTSPVIWKSHESFLSTLTEAVALRRRLTDRERVPFHLFAASFFQPTVDGRFLLLVMAVEALIEPAPKSAEAVACVDLFMKQIEELALEQDEKKSLTGSLRWLKDESINQAGRRLAKEHLSAKVYDGKVASSFFSHVYALRSSLVHGKVPAFEEISHAVAPLEQFVSDLLAAPLMEFRR